MGRDQADQGAKEEIFELEVGKAHEIIEYICGHAGQAFYDYKIAQTALTELAVVFVKKFEMFLAQDFFEMDFAQPSGNQESGYRSDKGSQAGIDESVEEAKQKSGHDNEWSGGQKQCGSAVNDYENQRSPHAEV